MRTQKRQRGLEARSKAPMRCERVGWSFVIRQRSGSPLNPRQGEAARGIRAYPHVQGKVAAWPPWGLVARSVLALAGPETARKYDVSVVWNCEGRCRTAGGCGGSFALHWRSDRRSDVRATRECARQ